MSAIIVEGRRINPPPVGGHGLGNHPPALTPRELDVLLALARGVPRKQVAARQCVTEDTVHSLARTAFRRLGVTSLVEAMNIMGWVRTEG